MNFFFRLKQKFAAFMYGRYGPDNLYNFLTVAYLAVVIVNLFLRSYILALLELVLIFYTLFRFFSRNVYKRSAENRKYLSIKAKIKGFFTLSRQKAKERKTHIYKKCPSCKSVLRLPRTKGKHTVKCPRCAHRFDMKVR